MAKQQGGLAYLIGVLVVVLVLVAPAQYSKDFKEVVRKAAQAMWLVKKEKPSPVTPAEAKPEPEAPKPETAPPKEQEPPKAAEPLPPPAQAQPAPSAAPPAEPAPTPAKPEPPKPTPPAQPPTKPEEQQKTQPPPEEKPAPPKEVPKEQPQQDVKRQDGGGIMVPLAQQAPAAPAAQEQTAPANGREGFVARLIDKIPSAHFTLADALVWIIFILWVIKVIVYREIKQLRWLPVPILVFLVLAVLSMISYLKPGRASVDEQAGVKELIQYIEYLILGYLIIANNVDTERTFRRIVRVLLLATTIVIAIGLLQYFSVTRPVENAITKLGPLSNPVSRLAAAPGAMEIRATFGNRNAFGAFLAVMLPLLWGIALAHRGGLAIVTRIWLVVLTIAGLIITTSGGAMLAIMFSVLAITFIRDEKFFFVVLVLGILAGVFLTRYLPRKNVEMLRDSVELFKIKDADPPRSYGWQQRYIEWQAGLNAMCAHPVFGVGVGNYQQNIGMYYPQIADRPAENYMEHDGVNGLFVLGVTLGVPGLLAFLWILFKFQKLGAMGYSLLPRGLAKGFSLGIYGSMMSVLIVSLFTNVMVRGVGIVLVIVLALAGQVNNLLPDAQEEPDTKES